MAAKASSVLDFMLNGPRCAVASRRELERGLSQTAWQLLNVANVWLDTFMPHVLSKIDRVSFGLLSYESDIAKQPRMPESRKLSAVPFIGKDKPSPRSEFAHPDVIIGFTIIAFRYEGLRRRDFRTLLAAEKAAYRDERETYDKPEKCPSSKRWVEWVHGAGGVVRGAKTRRAGQRRASAAARDAAAAAAAAALGSADLLAGADPKMLIEVSVPEDDLFSQDKVPPLFIADARDDAQLRHLHALLAKEAAVVWRYLDAVVFPKTMRYHGMKLAASGQCLGGDMLFGTRVGFSGTPSSLLPHDFGTCRFAKGDEGKMIHTLTDVEGGTMEAPQYLADGWTVRSLLQLAAQRDTPSGGESREPQFRALIDSGALITGMTNAQVARALADAFEAQRLAVRAVVYFDTFNGADDVKLAMFPGGAVSELGQAHLEPKDVFAYYDQIHTTGQVRCSFLCLALFFVYSFVCSPALCLFTHHSFIYRYISHESCSQFDSLPLTSLTSRRISS